MNTIWFGPSLWMACSALRRFCYVHKAADQSQKTNGGNIRIADLGGERINCGGRPESGRRLPVICGYVP